MAVTSIRMMVSMGPWRLNQIDDRGEDPTDRESCERCPQQGLRYVYVVQLAEEPGARIWRIGSECGPTLLTASAEKWDGAEEKWEAAVAAGKQALRLLHRLEKVIAFERDNPTHPDVVDFVRGDPEWASKRRAMLLDRTMDDRKRRHTGGVLSVREKKYFPKRRRS